MVLAYYSQPKKDIKYGFPAFKNYNRPYASKNYMCLNIFTVTEYEWK